MATGAVNFDVDTRQREGRPVVVEGDTLPRTGRVTRGAARTELTAMDFRVGVATHAGGGRALIDIVDVATGAGDLAVGTSQPKGRLVVVEGDTLPRSSGVASHAVGTELSKVDLRISVATHAGGGRALVDVVDVATGADDLDVGTRQREGGLAVVEGDALPCVGRVARGAVSTELAEMHLRVGVTIYTGGGRALVDVVAVTIGADDFNVGTRQREGGLVVVERGTFPGVDIVAARTVGAKSALVDIIGLVATETRRAETLETRRVTGLGVTTDTCRGGVLAFQTESERVVVEATVAVYAIVTGDTISAEVGNVTGDEISLIGGVAVLAVAGGKAISPRWMRCFSQLWVTISAGEGQPGGGGAVGC